MSIPRASLTTEPDVRVQAFLTVTDQMFGKKLATALIVGLLAALLIGIESYATITRLTALRAQGFATHDLVRSLMEVVKSVDDAETGQRGFIITGEESYLAQYDTAKAALPDELKRLSVLMPSEDQTSLGLLNDDINDKMSELQQTIDLRRTKGYEAARTVIMTDRGKQAMDRIRTRISGLSGEREARFQFLVRKINSLYQRILLLMSVLLAFEFVLFVGVLIMINRDRAARLENARMLSDHNERLRNQRDNLNFANDHLEVAFRRFESLFQGVPVSCTCTGPKGEILEWNRASELLFGYSSEEATKTTIYRTIIRPSGVANARGLTAQVMAGQSFENVEWTCRTRDGREIEVMSNALPLVGEDGLPLGVMTATIDMTERKAVERLKSEFVSTVSHELRTPLTSIRGALGLVCSGAAGDLPDQAQRLCDIANNNTERLVRLINDILDIEKIETGNLAFSLADCSMTDLARNAVEATKGYADQFDVHLVLRAEEAGVKVNGDADRLMQVLSNLMSNAIKFSPAGGDVVVEVKNLEQSVRVSVQDNGPGIPEEFQPRIFGRFAQADSADTRQKGGTGLGLSISKSIVERLDGRIWFDTLDNGTRFSFELPQAAPGHVNVPITDSAKALICEDDKDVVKILLALLAQKGIPAHVSYTAAQAKELLSQEAYDVMILDILLPDLNGLDLLQEVRSDPRTAHLPVVVVSVTSPHGLGAITGDAVIDWIGKPLDSKRFLDAVLQAIMLNSIL